MVKTCYLCGRPIEGKPTADHVPPQQVYAPEVRRGQNLDSLTTLPTHKACNESYGRDEDYFVWTLAPLARETPAADAVVRRFAEKFQSGQSVGLGNKILQQYTDRPSGLFLPDNLVALRVEGDRLERVAWKIVRGLFWIENESFLPEETPHMIEIVEPASRGQFRHPEFWERVTAQASKGVYPGVFDYKYLHAKAGELQVHLWGTLFWDQVMTFVAHHQPTIDANGPA